MKANELRIGNYILSSTGEVIKCLMIRQNSDISNLKPIPLTEEWLLKFGFEVYEFDHKSNQYGYKNRLIVIRDGLFVEYGSNVKIQYVHQLQNLIYALTGEELNAK
jgi:hypothetical protein